MTGRVFWLMIMSMLFQGPLSHVILAADPQVLKPRVPPNQIEEARSWENPFSPSPENIDAGKKLFHGRGFV